MDKSTLSRLAAYLSGGGSRAVKRERRQAEAANAAIQQEIIDAAIAKRARRAQRPQGRS